jgi:hypothetical protein
MNTLFSAIKKIKDTLETLLRWICAPFVLFTMMVLHIYIFILKFFKWYFNIGLFLCISAFIGSILYTLLGGLLKPEFNHIAKLFKW